MKTKSKSQNLQNQFSPPGQGESRMRSLALAMILVLSFSTVACRFGDSNSSGSANSQSPVSGSQPQATSSDNGGGGVIDSSGGDLVRSSNEQVNEASKDFNHKLLIAVNRISMHLKNAEKLDFEKAFGGGSYDLLRNFTQGSAKNLKNPLWALIHGQVQYQFQDQPCIGDHQDKDGSAYRDAQGKPTICLSRQSMRTMSPDSLQIDVIALGMHELSHLYGYDEPRAVQIQHVVLDHESMIWPNADVLNDLVTVENDGVENLLSIFLNYHVQYDQGICPNDKSLWQDLTILDEMKDGRRSLVLPDWMQDIFGDGLWATLSSVCANTQIPSRDLTAPLIEGAGLESYLSASASLQTLQSFRDPLAKTTTMGLDEYTQFASIQESLTAIKKAGKPESIALTKQVSDLYCRFDVEGAQAAVKGKVQRAKGDGTFNIPAGWDLIMQAQKEKGQRGFSFWTGSKRARLAAWAGGDLAEGATDSQQYDVVVQNEVPGFEKAFEVHYVQTQSNGSELRFAIRCGVGTNGSVPNLSPIDSSKLTYSVYDQPPVTVRAISDEQDTHFETKSFPRITLNETVDLTRQAASYGTRNVKGQVQSIRYDGDVTLFDGQYNCKLSSDLIRQKGQDPLRLAQDLQAGKYHNVSCLLIGVINDDVVSALDDANDYSLN